jgi:hypothetical protein
VALDIFFSNSKKYLIAIIGKSGLMVNQAVAVGIDVLADRADFSSVVD